MTPADSSRTPAQLADAPPYPLTGLQKGLLMLASVAMGTGLSINFVVVAPLTRKAGLGEVEVAAILTLSTAIYALMIPVWGRLADRFGRKEVMVFSLLAMAVTNMAFLFTLDAALAGAITGSSLILMLSFVRLWFGLLSPGLQPASMAAMTDATTATTRAAGLGMLSAGMSLGSIIGPAGAALLASYGALAPLWGSIAFCVVAAILVAIWLPSARNPSSIGANRSRLGMTDRRVRPHLLFLVAYFTCIGMIQQTLGWFIEDRYGFRERFGTEAGERTILYAGIAFASIAASGIAVQFGYISRQQTDPYRLLPLGLSLVSVGYFAADVFHPFWAMCTAFVLVGIGSALAIPSANALGSLAVPRADQAAAAALMSAAPPMGFIFGPLIGAALYELSPSLPFYSAAGLVFSLAALALYRSRGRAA